MVEAQLRLHGWSSKRRVVIVRQRVRGGTARKRHIDGKPLRLDLAGPSVHEGDRLWGYAALVTAVKYPLGAMGQLYRDRADAENAFDELKNQWGLGGSRRTAGAACCAAPATASRRSSGRRSPQRHCR